MSNRRYRSSSFPRKIPRHTRGITLRTLTILPTLASITLVVRRQLRINVCSEFLHPFSEREKLFLRSNLHPNHRRAPLLTSRLLGEHSIIKVRRQILRIHALSLRYLRKRPRVFFAAKRIVLFGPRDACGLVAHVDHRATTRRASWSVPRIMRVIHHTCCHVVAISTRATHNPFVLIEHALRQALASEKELPNLTHQCHFLLLVDRSGHQGVKRFLRILRASSRVGYRPWLRRNVFNAFTAIFDSHTCACRGRFGCCRSCSLAHIFRPSALRNLVQNSGSIFV